jgi:hypothetical protein
MSINYTTAVKNARMAVVQTAIEAGAGVGQLRLYTAAYATLLVTFALEDGQVPSAGALALIDAPASAVSVATGTATIARITDSTGAVVADGLTVGTAGTDVTLDTNVIAVVGQNVSLNTAVLTHG